MRLNQFSSPEDNEIIIRKNPFDFIDGFYFLSSKIQETVSL